MRLARNRFCERLADRSGMFKAVAGTGRDHEHAVHPGMAVDNKRAAGTIRIKTDRAFNRARGNAGKIRRDIGLEELPRFVFGDAPIHIHGIRRFKILLGAELDAVLDASKRGKPVDDLRLRDLPDKRRKIFRHIIVQSTSDL